MKNLYAFLLMALALAGCLPVASQAETPQQTQRWIERQTANAVASGANAALPMLVERYSAEGHQAIDAVVGAGGAREQAEEALQRVRDKWAPVWKAWESLRIAEDAWATVLEQGTDTSVIVAELKRAYCELQAVWPLQDVPVLPLVPIKCPIEEPTDAGGVK